MSYRTRLMGLIDGATDPSIYELVMESGTPFLSVYEGLPEAALGQAGLFLIEIEDPDAEWVVRVDQLDLQTPCLSLIWSRVSPDDLAVHLRAFLIVDIPGGKTALMRYFDPRATGAVFQVWPDSLMGTFISPIERWLYRGRNKDWQRVENDSLTGADICQSVKISLDQTQLDLLTAHCEPDGMLAALIELGRVDPDVPYLDRLSDFMPRYERAVHWGLIGAVDRKRYCEYSYLQGETFDRHPYVHGVLSERETTGDSFDAVMDRVPRYVWAEVERAQVSAGQQGDPGQ
jgi:hypothetical protein